jgi:hypothetical protein
MTGRDSTGLDKTRQDKKMTENQKTYREKNIYTQELIRVLKEVEEDNIIPYQKLSFLVGINIRPNHEGYRYLHSARHILERDHDVAFKTITGKGLKRMTPEQVANETGHEYILKKKSLIRHSKRRIKTIDDSYEKLSNDAKIKATLHRTMLAFDNEFSKSKNILKIENHVQKNNMLIGFDETIKLFEKKKT